MTTEPKTTEMATNSIIIANLPDWSTSISNKENGQENVQEEDSEKLPSTFIESLRALIEVHREIVHWIPMRRSVLVGLHLTFSFRRVCCVFISKDDAEVVKCALNGCIFEGHRLDVYFGEVSYSIRSS